MLSLRNPHAARINAYTKCKVKSAECKGRTAAGFTLALV
jgi:hypothetical protein